MENLEFKINFGLETNWAKTESKPEWMKHIRTLQKLICLKNIYFSWDLYLKKVRFNNYLKL